MIARFSHFMNYRPLSILSMCGGVRDILLGIGFLIGWAEITQTLIYQNYDQLVPGYSGISAGVMFVLAGLAVIISSIKYKRNWMAQGLKIQAMTWLFSTLMYLLNGHILLAAIFGIFFCFPAGYIAFYVKYHPSIDEQMRELMEGN